MIDAARVILLLLLFSWLFLFFIFPCNGKLAVYWTLCSKSILINVGLWLWREDSAKCIFLILSPACFTLDSISRALGGNLNVELARWTFSSGWLLFLWSYQQPFTTPSTPAPLCPHAILAWLLVPASNTVLYSEKQSPCSPLTVHTGPRWMVFSA